MDLLRTGVGYQDLKLLCDCVIEERIDRPVEDSSAAAGAGHAAARRQELHGRRTLAPTARGMFHLRLFLLHIIDNIKIILVHMYSYLILTPLRVEYFIKILMRPLLRYPHSNINSNQRDRFTNV